MIGGVYVYVGQTQSGKTTRALDDLRADVAADGRPSLILDLGPALNFRGTPHAKNREEVLTELYGRGRHVCYTPGQAEDSGSDFDCLLEGVSECGGIHVLLDEVRWVASAHRISDSLTRALRHWGHGSEGPVTYRCTSQRPGDLHRDFYACLTGELYAFRTGPGPDLDRLVAEFGFDPVRLQGLPRGDFLTYSGQWLEKSKGVGNDKAKAVHPDGDGAAPGPDAAGPGSSPQA